MTNDNDEQPKKLFRSAETGKFDVGEWVDEYRTYKKHAREESDPQDA